MKHSPLSLPFPLQTGQAQSHLRSAINPFSPAIRMALQQKTRANARVYLSRGKELFAVPVVLAFRFGLTSIGLLVRNKSFFAL